MIRTRIALAGLVVLLGATVGGAAAKAGDGRDGARGAQVVGYYIEWGIYGRGYTVKNVETSGSASRLTAINYAFANAAPDASGNVVCKLADEWADYQKPWSAAESVNGQEVTWPRPVLGNFQQLQALKAMHPGLKVLISIGGWTFSKWFSDAALTPASRAAFVSSCVDLFIKGNLPDPGWGGMGGPGSAAGLFDGIDVDWEWPGSAGNDGNIIRPEDRANLTLLLAEFRRQLDAAGTAAGKRYLLTQFLPADAAKVDAGFEPARIFRSLDWGALQGYDLHGPWEATTNHQSNLLTSPFDPARPRFSNADTVLQWARRGAPLRQLVLGVPFYSHGWAGVGPANHGLYQPAAGAAPGTWEAGTDDYKVVKTRLAQGFVRYNDFAAGASWLYNPATGIFWTFDDPLVLRAKAAFVRIAGLGGAMFWELSGDTSNGELIAALADGLR